MMQWMLFLLPSGHGKWRQWLYWTIFGNLWYYCNGFWCHRLNTSSEVRNGFLACTQLTPLGSLSNTDAAGTKTSLKFWIHTASNFIVLILSRSIREMLANFFRSCTSNRMYQSSGKEKESRFLVFTYSTKREIRHFHVVVLQWRRRNDEKRKSVINASAELMFCFSNTSMLFSSFRSVINTGAFSYDERSVITFVF